MKSISIEYFYKKIYSKEKESILDALRNEGISMVSPCNGVGTCGKCKIKILEGKVSNLTDVEKEFGIEFPYRLACQCYPLEDIKIKLMSEYKNPKINKELILPEILGKKNIDYEILSSKDILNTEGNSYIEKIEAFLKASFRKELLLSNKKMNILIEKEKFIFVILNGVIIDVKAFKEGRKLFGIGIDLGTTTVILSLVNLKDKKIVREFSFFNPQQDYGDDVLSRLTYANNFEFQKKLQDIIIKNINNGIKELFLDSNENKDDCYLVSVAGNTAMIHLLLGLSGKMLGKSPYLPVILKEKEFLAKGLDIDINSQGEIWFPPNVSSFIGSDIVVGGYSVFNNLDNDIELFIDIGTNGEMILFFKDKIYACSCAAGPALEGMNIECGIKASDGAIEVVGYNNKDNKFFYETINKKFAIGLCGSGLISWIAALIKNDLVDSSGRFTEKLGKTGFLKDNKIYLSLENEGVYLSQKDIRQVQLAKSAIKSGILMLLDKVNCDFNSIEKITIAGQFGKHLKVEDLIELKILPKTSKKSVKYVGNTSKKGAIINMLSKKVKDELSSFAKKIEYIELSTEKNYQKYFLDSIKF